MKTNGEKMQHQEKLEKLARKYHFTLKRGSSLFHYGIRAHVTVPVIGFNKLNEPILIADNDKEHFDLLKVYATIRFYYDYGASQDNLYDRKKESWTDPDLYLADNKNAGADPDSQKQDRFWSFFIALLLIALAILAGLILR